MKNSFVVRFGVGLWLTSIGLTGFWAAPVAWIASMILGSLLDKAIIEIDLSIDSLKQAIKEPQWKDEAKKAYDHAMARVYTEKEKNAIRQEYLDALSHFATFGNGMPDNEHT